MLILYDNSEIVNDSISQINIINMIFKELSLKFLISNYKYCMISQIVKTIIFDS
mgnify:CR=1 FL=1